MDPLEALHTPGSVLFLLEHILLSFTGHAQDTQYNASTPEAEPAHDTFTAQGALGDAGSSGAC